MEKKILLIKSELMDSNKKKERNEDSLIRLPKQVRRDLDLEESVELHNNGTDAVESLGVYKAFSKDVKLAKDLITQGNISREDLSIVFFVSSNSYMKLGNTKSDITEVGLSTTFNHFLIGTDPELLLMKDGKVHHANHVPGFNKSAEFGSDGAMAEIRPKPASTPDGLVKNMIKIFSKIDSGAEGYDWVSSCYQEDNGRDYPVGAHIHLGNPAKIAKLLDTKGKNRLFAVTNKILDELITIPMIRMDGKSGYKRRARCKMSHANGFGGGYGQGYGFFGEWRGKHGRLEFRSLSGLVISNPKLCEAVFGTAMAVTEAVYREAIRNKLDSEIILPSKFNEKSIYRSDFDSWGDIPLAEIFGCTKSSKVVADTLNKSSRTDITSSYINEWANKILSLESAHKYEKYIGYLAEVLSGSTNSLNKIDRNIKKTWRNG